MIGEIWVSKVKRESDDSYLMLEACRKAVLDGRAFKIIHVYCQEIGSATEFHIEQPFSAIVDSGSGLIK